MNLLINFGLFVLSFALVVLIIVLLLFFQEKLDQGSGMIALWMLIVSVNSCLRTVRRK